MRHFNVTVNGQSYQVSVEEAGSAPAITQNNAQPAPTPVAVQSAPVQSPVPAAPAAPVAAQDGEKITAPMPGTMVDIKTAVGSAVKKGDVVLILEAMKMENEILTPADGVVKQVLVSKGAAVNSGDVLMVIG